MLTMLDKSTSQSSFITRFMPLPMQVKRKIGGDEKEEGEVDSKMTRADSGKCLHCRSPISSSRYKNLRVIGHLKYHILLQ